MIDLREVQTALDLLKEGDVHGALEMLTTFCDSNRGHNALIPEAIVAEALTIQRKAYDSRAAEVTRKMAAKWTDADFASTEEALQELEQFCTFWDLTSAHVALHTSSNANAAAHRIGVEALDWRNGFPVVPLAEYALQADVIELLKDEGIDIYQAPPQSPVRRCSVCDKFRPLKFFETSSCDEICTACDDEAEVL